VAGGGRPELHRLDEYALAARHGDDADVPVDRPEVADEAEPVLVDVDDDDLHVVLPARGQVERGVLVGEGHVVERAEAARDLRP
jgi:hypothetical protein